MSRGFFAEHSSQTGQQTGMMHGHGEVVDLFFPRFSTSVSPPSRPGVSPRPINSAQFQYNHPSFGREGRTLAELPVEPSRSLSRVLRPSPPRASHIRFRGATVAFLGHTCARHALPPMPKACLRVFSTWRFMFSPRGQPPCGWDRARCVCLCSVPSHCAALDGAPGGQPGQAAVGGRSAQRDALSDGIREQLQPLYPGHAEGTLQPGKKTPRRRHR